MAMKTAQQAREGTIVHTELVSRDPATTRAFLEGLFGWTFREQQTPEGRYHAATTPNGEEAGIRPAVEGDLKVAVPYIGVHDLRLAESLIERHGGRILQGRTDVAGRGAFLWFEAPGGPVLGLWQDHPGASEP